MSLQRRPSFPRRLTPRSVLEQISDPFTLWRIPFNMTERQFRRIWWKTGAIW